MGIETKKIILRKGLAANTPNLTEGEPGYQTDLKTVVVGTDSGIITLAKVGHTHVVGDVVGLQTTLNNLATQLSNTVLMDELKTINGTSLLGEGDIPILDLNITPSDVGAEPANSNIQTHIGAENNPHNVTKEQLGLSAVDNTSDLDKPISTAAVAALSGKASLESPVFTGTPKAPTAGQGTNDTQIASTQFVQTAIANAITGNVDLSNALQWVYVGKVVGANNDPVVTINSSTLSQSFDWGTYDYHFVYDGSTNGEDGSLLQIYFDNYSTVAGKYSYQYHRTISSGGTSVDETVATFPGGTDNGTVLHTGIMMYTTSSVNGQMTATNCEFTVHRTAIAPSANMYGWFVRGEGSSHYITATQDLSTSIDGMSQSRFIGQYKQVSNLITSVHINHGLTAGDPESNIVRVYKRKR